MSLRDFSAIARPVNPEYGTNKAIALITAVLAVGSFIFFVVLTGAGLFDSAAQAGGLGLAVFLTWALCREIDPDRDLAAFVAAGLAFIGVLLWDLPNLAVIFWLLFAIRVVNRTTGLLTKPLDSIALLALATWLAFQIWWPIGALTALAFLLDGWFEKPHLRHRMFSVLALALTLGAASIAEPSWNLTGPSWASGGIVTLLCFVSFPVFAATRELTTLTDDTQEHLDTARVRAGQMLALVTGVAAVLWMGADGFALLWPLWSGVLGASAYLLVKSPTS